jgi:ribosome-binding factor A
MPSTRLPKINELVRKYVNDIILKDLSLKSGVFVTIAKVDTSPDVRYTRVFISVFPENEFPYALKTLDKERHNIQLALNKKLRIKPLPRLEFRSDFTESEADKIEKLLKEL